jgi:hypothetical protein
MKMMMMMMMRCHENDDVVGFGFYKAIPDENFPTINTFRTL